MPAPAEYRHAPRLKLAPMYTLLRARRIGEKRYRWTGYIYDVSMSGMRFELDEPLDLGSLIEVRALLPGGRSGAFHATGHVVRIHEDPEDVSAGPVRMGLQFQTFRCTSDEVFLNEYLDAAGLRLAA